MYQRKPAKFIGALAAIVAAIEGALLLTRKTAEAAPITVVSLAKEAMDLLIAMAEGVGAILEKLDLLDVIIDKLDDIITAIKGIPGGGGGPGFPLNTETFGAQYINCPVAQPQSYPLPNIDIPDGFEIELLARNPAGANTGIIYVSPTQPGASGNIQAWPLLPNATIRLGVKNASSIFIGSTVPGEGIYFAVEQRRP